MQSQRLLIQLHWVWVSLQFGTKHPIDLGYYDINFVLNTNVTTMERIGFSAMSCVSTVTDCFVLFSRQSGGRWSIYLESLSLTSVASISRSFLSESVLAYLGLDCCFGHCVRALFVSLFTYRFCTVVPCQGDAFIRLSLRDWAKAPPHCPCTTK